MSESVILCEGFHDRAFWDGWLTSLLLEVRHAEPTARYGASSPGRVTIPGREGREGHRQLQ
jgi:hypothetical protein